MATKSGIIYTCECGWVDLGHANPYSKSPDVGADNLWRKISGETGERSANNLWYRIDIEMMMSKQIPVVGRRISDGVRRSYAVRLGLDTPMKEAVALSIFMAASRAFERLQSSGVYGVLTDSGFSAEDLVSNLLGFYSVVRPGTDYVKTCMPVPLSDAQRIWRSYGAPGSDTLKNRTTRALLFPCGACPKPRRSMSFADLPAVFRCIVEVPIGADYREWNPADPALTTMPAPPAAKPAGPPSPKQILVVKGMTLSGLAKTEYGDWRLWPLLWDANRTQVGSNPNMLRTGISLMVPPLARFSEDDRRSAMRRAPDWKVFPH